MKEGFLFDKVSLKFLWQVIFNSFGGGGKQKRALFLTRHDFYQCVAGN